MKTENETSEAFTATTSPTGPESKSARTSEKPEAKPGEAPAGSSEADFLAQQAIDAKAALTRTLSEIGNSLGQSVNVAGWTRQYPWLALGASTLAGFVATAALVPSKEDQALRKLAKIEKALNPPAPPKPSEPDGDSAKQFKTGQTSFTRSMLGEVIKAVQPALLSMLTAGVTAKATKPSEQEMRAAAAAEDAGAPPAA